MGRAICCYCYCRKNVSDTADRRTPHGLFYRDVPHFVNAEGYHLFCRYWIPTTPVRALMMIIHDASGHCGRYTNLVDLFLECSLLVFSHDHVGHGQSEGKRMNISDFRIYTRDCLQHIDMMKRRYPDLELYVTSLSMGGLIHIYVMHERPSVVDGSIFLAPLVLMNPQSATPIKMLLARLLYHMLPQIPLGYIDPLAISSDNQQVMIYINDPLVYHGPVTVKFAFEVLNALNKIEKIFPTITSPVLIMHGDADTLSDIRGSYIMYGKVGSADKTFKTFQRASHELHHEPLPVRTEVLRVIGKWLEERLPPAT